MTEEASSDQPKAPSKEAPEEKAVQVGFYHLTRTSLEEALPRLLGRTLETGERAVVRCPTAARVTELDKALWEQRTLLWLPHGTAKMGYATRQPIWLSAKDECPNGARFLFRIDGAGEGAFGSIARVFDLFDGRDHEAVVQARQRWKAAKAAGCELTYWKQEPQGWRRAG